MKIQTAYGRLFRKCRHDLGALGGTASYAADVNNNGQVVGYAVLNSVQHAFVYENNQMTDLNNLVDSGLGWTLNRARAVNDLGQIVGYGTNASGQIRAFLLTPIPEPSTLALLTAAALGWLCWAWRTRQ